MENQKCKDAVAKAKEFFSKKNYFWTKVAAIVLAVIILLIILILCLTLCTRHKHTYSDEWSYDETYHYHAATCEHEDEVSDKAAHSFLYAKCTVCSYSIESNTEVQIAEGTTTIGTNAYINMDQIGFVVIPETVEEIEENAFPETVIIYIKGKVRDFEYPDDNMYFYSEEKPTDDTKNYWHYVDGEIKSWHEHTIVSVSGISATCTANGTSAHYKCTECGKLFSDEAGTTEVTLASLTISAHHTLNKTDKVNATCTADGRQEYYTCSVCNKIFGDSTGTTETTLDNLKINKLGHDMTHHAKVAATSTTTGTIEYWSCNRCGKNFSDEDGTTEVTTLTIPIVTNYKYVEGSTTAIYFGSYPQTQVTDTDLRNTLTTKAGTLPTSGNPQNWTDYGYYKSNSVSSYMFYIDIDNDSDGDYDYRGVYFTGYRPYSTATDPTFNEPQRLNAYYPNTVYWFKYEPIKWNILKTENNKALIISDLLLDSQDYNYTKNSRTNVSDYQDNTSTGTIYSNNYMYSHIRSWLNTTFYNTAFSDLEKQIIETTVVDNSVESTASTSNSYVCSNTSDNMFLLSSKEATTYYSSNSERIAQGSDYAKCQGLSVNTSSGNSNYWLRSPRSDNESRTNDINVNGGIAYLDTNQTQFGVRAACWINL